MPARSRISINRAPVLTLWATVVARRLGFREKEALSLGKALAGLNAQSKGRRLGIFTPDKATLQKARKQKPGEVIWVELCGRAIPARNGLDGLRAVRGDDPVTAASTRRYLESKFGEALPDVRAAMEELARALPPRKLADVAFQLYEAFRPKIPAGRKGWGAPGVLSLTRIRGLADKV